MGIVGSLLDLIILAAAGRWLLPHVVRFLQGHGQVESNYTGHTVPRGLGVFLWLLLWLHQLTIQLTSFAAGRELEANRHVFAFAATLVFLLGWTDDLIGHKEVKGLRGHFRYWKESKTVSMGAVKALGIASAAAWLVISVHNKQTPHLWVGGQIVMVMLMTNALNLLDVRPGRSLKVFFAGIAAVGLLGFAIARHLPVDGLQPLGPIVLGAAFLYGTDVRGRGMLGDAGANLLGFTLGYAVLMCLPWGLQLFITAVLGYVHRQAEVSSLTLLIERNRFLHWLDRLGRT
ncbi:hypothetical protein ACFPES_10980 [Paenibacillus sp. GCM10023248]|uniref:hypothetical protein n=1 Tax=unclassified Paenibacillus TaxID=185978 RepID=UPI00237969EB|nr:hypothetical protein [Paenibacillus sp. MAHUQ-63]MDD9267547.1 hypothetical protein [Paenibacillus sp. MAHUQ-63]